MKSKKNDGQTNEILSSEGSNMKHLLDYLRNNNEGVNIDARFMYKLAFDAISDAIVWIDVATNEIINCNKNFTELVGNRKSDLIGCNGECYCTKELQILLQSDSKDNIILDSHYSDGTIITEKGEVIPVSLSSSIFEIENKRILQNIYRNLSYLKTAEANYKMLFMELNQGIALIGEDGSIHDANPEFLRQCGRTLDELRKLKIWEIRPPELQEKSKETFELVKQKGGGEIFGLDIQKPDGSITNIKFGSKKVEINGKTYLQSITTDITSEVITEEILSKQQEILRKQREELDSFCTSVAHDIRGKLQVVTLYSDLSTDKEYSKKIATQIQDIVQFLNDMLMITKTGVIGEFEEVNLNLLLMDILVNLRILKPDLVVDLLKMPVVKGVKVKLRQVFENLIMNVIRHSDATELKIYSKKEKDYHQIFVEDNGVGMSEELQNQIRLSWDTGRYLTIGLMIAKKIMLLHKGDLDFRSKVNKGTTFILEFPLKN